MTATDYVIAFALWVGYAALAACCVWGAIRVTRNAARWQRRALVSAVMAIFFAPSVVGGGHGGGIAPAWIALFQMFPIKLGVVPIVATFTVFFVLSSVVSWVRRKQETSN